MARHTPIEVVTGAIVLLIAGGFLVFAVANTGRGFGRDGYVLHAVFDHVDGLSTGADVRVAGVKVGSVGAIKLDPKTYQADVTFSVQHDVSLTTDSSATISTDGLLGGKYVALATGGEDATLKPGGTITITQGSVNIEALIGKYIFGSTGGKGGDKTGGTTPK
jgi:phospholipid/cholesterol/gamma-HCH transport system substrate-binding protein